MDIYIPILLKISSYTLFVTVGLFLLGLILLLIFKKLIKSHKWIEPTVEFSPIWKTILIKKVNYYAALSLEEQKLFEFKVQEFLLNHRIVGIKLEVTLTDQLLIASSAIIPIFNFPDWKYANLHEILLYEDTFNHDFQTKGPNRNILGAVGTSGFLAGRMALSRRALHHGFSNASDKKNTAVHEFVHLIDELDGNIDGVPEVLLNKPYVIPWIKLVDEKIQEIYDHKSDINPYGGSNRQEFFAVISEYFFERPKLLAKKHPELYVLLVKIFGQKMKTKKLNHLKLSLTRNSPCPCGSGKKYKKCCGK